MKNTIKIYTVVLSLITIGCLLMAFTTKEKDGSKKFLMIRVVEIGKGLVSPEPVIQICDEAGNLTLKENIFEKGRLGGLDPEGTNTQKITALINEYSNAGYTLQSTNTSSGITGQFITTFIFSK